MADGDRDITALYTTDEYIEKNPSLHAEDSAWKIGLILPFVDRAVPAIARDPLVVLDVGGGAGLILREVAAHIASVHGRKVTKYALDLSPGMLAVQRRNNPDLARALNEDLRATSLGDREVDLVLLIDVIEHVPEPERAFREVGRIARYALVKVPLERNLWFATLNAVKLGRLRRRMIERNGHINAFAMGSFRALVAASGGRIVECRYADTFSYRLRAGQAWGIADRVANRIGAIVHRASPALAAALFTDCAVALVDFGATE